MNDSSVNEHADYDRVKIRTPGCSAFKLEAIQNLVFFFIFLQIKLVFRRGNGFAVQIGSSKSKRFAKV